MIGELFNMVLLRPIMNALLLLYTLFGHNYALALVVLTVVLRLITQPFMASQLKTSKKMTELQPRLKELEKKYANDKERLAQEQMKLYREQGINPLGGCLPMLAQFPIWIALYQAIIQTLGRSPMQLLSLSKHIYSAGIFKGLPLLIPLASKFLWMDLGRPDPTGIVIPLLTGVTMWVQQKMMTPASTGQKDSQAQMSQSMMLMMPFIFAIFTMSLPAGLGVYFIISNLVGIVMQYFLTGWGSLNLGSLGSLLPRRAAVAVQAQPSASADKATRPVQTKAVERETRPAQAKAVEKGTKKSGSRKKKR